MADLLTLDPASNTGWCLSPPFREVMRIRIGSWRVPKDSTTQQKCSFLAVNLNKLLSENEVMYAAVEIPNANMGSRKVTKKTPLGFEQEVEMTGNAKTQNQLWAIHGAMIAVLSCWGIPYRTIAPRTWRTALGIPGGDDAPAECKRRLEKHGVHVPNKDAAEAGGIQYWLQNHYRRFMAEDEALAKMAGRST